MSTASDPGLLFVISSPSGAGKTTLCRRLIAEFSRISFSVSFTTRPRRTTELDGVDYYFVSDEIFSEMVARGEFAEWAEVHGNRYGTAWSTIRQCVEAGRDVIFDIDWQGGLALKQSADFGASTVMIFVLPPSMEELARRLRGRGTDAPEVVERRLAMAKAELEHHREYHYVIINDALETAYQELKGVYIASRCEVQRRAAVVTRLLAAAPH